MNSFRFVTTQERDFSLENDVLDCLTPDRLTELRRRRIIVMQLVSVLTIRELRVVCQHHCIRDMDRYFGLFSASSSGLLTALEHWGEHLLFFENELRKKDYSEENWTLGERIKIALGLKCRITDIYYFPTIDLRERVRSSFHHMTLTSLEIWSLLPYEKSFLKSCGIGVEGERQVFSTTLSLSNSNWEEQELKVQVEETFDEGMFKHQMDFLDPKIEKTKSFIAVAKVRVMQRAVEQMILDPSKLGKVVGKIPESSIKVIETVLENDTVETQVRDLFKGCTFGLPNQVMEKILEGKNRTVHSVVQEVKRKSLGFPTADDKRLAKDSLIAALETRFLPESRDQIVFNVESFVGSLSHLPLAAFTALIGEKVSAIYAGYSSGYAYIPSVPNVTLPLISLPLKVQEGEKVQRRNGGGIRKKRVLEGGEDIEIELAKPRKYSRIDSMNRKESIRFMKISFFFDVSQNSRLMSFVCSLTYLGMIPDLFHLLITRFLAENVYNPVIQDGVFRPQVSKGFSEEELESLLVENEKSARSLTFGSFSIRLLYLTDKLHEVLGDYDRTCTLYLLVKAPGPYKIHLTMGTPSMQIRYGQEIENKPLICVRSEFSRFDWKSSRSCLPGLKWGHTYRLGSMKEYPVDNPLWITVYGDDFVACRRFFTVGSLDVKNFSFSDIACMERDLFSVLGQVYEGKFYDKKKK